MSSTLLALCPPTEADTVSFYRSHYIYTCASSHAYTTCNIVCAKPHLAFAPKPLSKHTINQRYRPAAWVSEFLQLWHPTAKTKNHIRLSTAPSCYKFSFPPYLSISRVVRAPDSDFYLNLGTVAPKLVSRFHFWGRGAGEDTTGVIWWRVRVSFPSFF